MKAKWFNKEQLEELGITDVSPDGEYLVHNGRLVHASKWTNGYLMFIIWHNNEKRICLSAHRAVALWYFYEIPEDYDVDHINHDTWDNRIENLRLLPKSENYKQKTKRIRDNSYYNAYRKQWRDTNKEHWNEYMRQYRAQKKAEGRAQLDSGKLEDSPESEVYQA